MTTLPAEPALFVIGLGEIGCSIVREALLRGWKVARCVDLDPSAASARLASYIDQAEQPPVEASIERLEPYVDEGTVAVLCTTSRASAVIPDVAACLDIGLDVVTTCEELAWPVPETAEALSELDLKAKAARCSVLATGINPGFVMDALPVVLASASLAIDSVEVRRSVPLGDRRRAFQRKVPTDVSLEEFGRLGDAVGHVGLAASACLVAERLGWPVEDLRVDMQPAVRKQGVVSGLAQEAVVWADGAERVRLRWEASDAVRQPADHIVIRGVPTIETTLRPSIHGDVGTVAMVLNGVLSLAASAHDGGLKCPADAWTSIGATLTAPRAK